MGPIDVYLVSQFEENFEEANAVEAKICIPDTSIANEDTGAPCVTNEIGKAQEVEARRMCSDASTSQDFMSGIMKIVPDVDNDADYWLLSDVGISITDMWRIEAGIDGTAWIQYLEKTTCMIPDIGTPQAQTPPPSMSATAMPCISPEVETPPPHATANLL